MEAMSKKEKLARGSAVIKVMKVIPRPGHFLSKYTDVHKLPRKPKPANAPKGALADAPHLNVKAALFEFLPMSARIEPTHDQFAIKSEQQSGDPCAIPEIIEEDINKGLPDGHKMLKWFGYREWINAVSPAYDGNVAEHFNILLGLLMTMAVDPDLGNFPDVEAYPCVQFLRTITTPEGEIPFNTGALLTFIEFVCNKLVEEG